MERREPSEGKRLLAALHDLFSARGSVLASAEVQDLLIADPNNEWIDFTVTVTQTVELKEPDGGRAHFAKWTAFPSSPVASRAQEKELGGHGSPAAGRKARSTPPESATRVWQHYLPEVRTRERVTVRKKHDRHGERRR